MTRDQIHAVCGALLLAAAVIALAILAHGVMLAVSL